MGQQADCVVLDGEHFALAGLPVAEQLDSHVFASSRSSAVASVWVAGQCQVEQGRHAQLLAQAGPYAKLWQLGGYGTATQTQEAA